MLVIRGAVKDYDWGIVDGLVDWTGTSTGAPQAELWFGVHPAGPSPMVDATGAPTGAHLADHLADDAVPVLVKLLAAGRPLSVQVHPTAPRAADLWVRQEQGSIAECLADRHEKTEMLVALGPFQALAGWRDVEQAARILEAITPVRAAAQQLRAGDVRAAMRTVLGLDPAGHAVAALPDAVASVVSDPAERHAYATIAALYPLDPGALLTPMLAYWALDAGDALYVPAGIPHSYLLGTGLEVMSSSDNVLRLGLTSKAVHVEESLGSLEVERVPVVVRSSPGTPVAPSGAPFSVTLLSGEGHAAPAGRYRMVLAVDAPATLRVDGAEIRLAQGSAAVLTAAEGPAQVASAGMAALVTDA